MKKKKVTKKKTTKQTKGGGPTPRKLKPSETLEMKRRSRRLPEVEVVPGLDVTMPVAHAGTGHLVAETFLEKNGAGILDIVAPRGTQVESWCCFARPARGKNKDWVVVMNHPDDNGRFRVPVPKTHFYVWNFGEVPADAEDGERVWRLHGHNVAFSGVGRDICWRVVLRLAPIAIPARAARKLPPRTARVKQKTPKPPKPVTIPVPA